MTNFQWTCEIFSKIIIEHKNNRDFCKKLITSLIENHGKEKVFSEMHQVLTENGFFREEFSTPLNEAQLNDREEP